MLFELFHHYPAGQATALSRQWCNPTSVTEQDKNSVLWPPPVVFPFCIVNASIRCKRRQCNSFGMAGEWK